MYILSTSPLSYPSWKIFSLAFLYKLLVWMDLVFPLEFISQRLYFGWLFHSSLFLIWIFWFPSNIIYSGFLKASSFGSCIYFSQEDFISSTRISWHLPRKSYLLLKKVISFYNPQGQQVASLFIWDSLYIILSRRSALVKEEVKTRSKRNTRILGKIVIFFLSSVNVDSSLLMNSGDMVYSLSTFSESW